MKLNPIVRNFLAAGAVAVVSATATLAASVTVNWTGEVTDPGRASGVSIGDAITGSFSYDSTSPEELGLPTFSFFDTGHDSSFVLGGFAGTFGNQRIGVFLDVSGQHQFDSRAPNVISDQTYSGSTIGGSAPTQLFVVLRDASATALTGTALPDSLDPADWDFPSPAASRIDGPSLKFVVTGFTTENLSAIPLPATLPMMLAVVGGIGLARRRRAPS